MHPVTQYKVTHSSTWSGVNAVEEVAAAVAPRLQLLGEPREQPGRGVLEPDPQRLRLGALLHHVAHRRLARLHRGGPSRAARPRSASGAPSYASIRQKFRCRPTACSGNRSAMFCGHARTDVAALEPVAVVAEVRPSAGRTPPRCDASSSPRSWVGADHPKPGTSGATTWNAWPPSAGSVSSGIASRNSWNDPGQPWTSIRGRASDRDDRCVDEVDRLLVDLGEEVLDLVEALLVRAPVEPVAPAVQQRRVGRLLRCPGPTRCRRSSSGDGCGRVARSRSARTSSGTATVKGLISAMSHSVRDTWDVQRNAGVECRGGQVEGGENLRVQGFVARRLLVAIPVVLLATLDRLPARHRHRRPARRPPHPAGRVAADDRPPRGAVPPRRPGARPVRAVARRLRAGRLGPVVRHRPARRRHGRRGGVELVPARRHRGGALGDPGAAPRRRERGARAHLVRLRGDRLLVLRVLDARLLLRAAAAARLVVSCCSEQFDIAALLRAGQVLGRARRATSSTCSSTWCCRSPR